MISLSDDPENEDGAKSPVDCLPHLSGQSDSSPGGNDIGARQRFISGKSPRLAGREKADQLAKIFALNASKSILLRCWKSKKEFFFGFGR